MKKRYVPIITFTVAMLLVGSIAYAADRRKKTKQINDESDNLSEEALKVELLSASDVQLKKTSSTLSTRVDMHLDELTDNATENLVSKVVTR